MSYILTDATNKAKRYQITTPEGKNIQFGSRAHENFTIHGDEKRKTSYLKRHSKNENWTKSGIDTAGYWSRWLLWNEPTIDESIKDIEKRFGIKVQNKIQKPSAYRSMRFGQKKSGNDETESRLLAWTLADWTNLTALLTDDQKLPCGKKGKKQLEMNLPTVCRPTRKNADTPLLAKDFSEAQIRKAIEIKKQGKRIDWNKL
jgi:hypothetical protein